MNFRLDQSHRDVSLSQALCCNCYPKSHTYCADRLRIACGKQHLQCSSDNEEHVKLLKGTTMFPLSEEAQSQESSERLDVKWVKEVCNARYYSLRLDSGQTLEYQSGENVRTRENIATVSNRLPSPHGPTADHIAQK